ncbi:Zn(2)-C6 fungal-type domain-containing protein [Mycena chlorophos]|uniref:Zn(2)-C6 fungal-type domain-containing protein n=1 Tax=Mycena chlorophos TaxID=658473 RepID=A0A8H6S7V9_MYCCL|nr:Zn(2)-C6 fungal-type domain-containing protein [Mycena chlorophos]
MTASSPRRLGISDDPIWPSYDERNAFPPSDPHYAAYVAPCLLWQDSPDLFDPATMSSRSHAGRMGRRIQQLAMEFSTDVANWRRTLSQDQATRLTGLLANRDRPPSDGDLVLYLPRLRDYARWDTALEHITTVQYCLRERWAWFQWIRSVALDSRTAEELNFFSYALNANDEYVGFWMNGMQQVDALRLVAANAPAFIMHLQEADPSPSEAVGSSFFVDSSTEISHYRSHPARNVPTMGDPAPAAQRPIFRAPPGCGGRTIWRTQCRCRSALPCIRLRNPWHWLKRHLLLSTQWTRRYSTPEPLRDETRGITWTQWEEVRDDPSHPAPFLRYVGKARDLDPTLRLYYDRDHNQVIGLEQRIAAGALSAGDLRPAVPRTNYDARGSAWGRTLPSQERTTSEMGVPATEVGSNPRLKLGRVGSTGAVWLPIANASPRGPCSTSSSPPAPSRTVQRHKAEVMRPDISVVNGLAVLGSFHSAHGEVMLAYMYWGMSTRIAQALGLSIDASSWVRSNRISVADVLDRNWMYWSMYAQDAVWATYVGRELCLPLPPSATHLREKGIPFAELDEIPWSFPHADGGTKVVGQPNRLAQTHGAACDLFLIMAKIMALVNNIARSATKISDQVISDIDIQLYAWKEGLAPEIALSPATRDKATPHRLMVHASYWWCFILLHRPFFYRTARAVHGSDAEVDHIKLCKRAAENIMELLQTWRTLFGLRYASIPLSQITFAAGTIFLLLAADATAPSRARVAQGAFKSALADAELCVQYLGEIGHSLNTANLMAGILGHLLVERVLPRVQRKAEKSISTAPAEPSKHSGAPVPSAHASSSTTHPTTVSVPEIQTALTNTDFSFSLPSADSAIFTGIPTLGNDPFGNDFAMSYGLQPGIGGDMDLDAMFGVEAAAFGTGAGTYPGFVESATLRAHPKLTEQYRIP